MTAIRQRTDDEALKLLVDVLDVVSIGVEQYKVGRTAAWLIVSNRLHQLLQDRTARPGNDLPLALRVFPAIELHPLRHPIDLEAMKAVGIVTQLVAQSFEFDANSIRGTVKFDTTKPKISLEDWLKQVVAVNDGVPVTLDQLIQASRHKSGGVHFDRNVNPTEHYIETLLTVVEKGHERPVFTDYLVSIAEYAHSELQAMVVALP